MSDGGTPAASLVAGLATAHWVATAIALCHGALAAYIAGDLKIMCATRRLVSASIVRALSPGRRQPTLPRHALRLRRYRLRPSRRLRTEAVCLQITPVTSATLPVRLPFPPPWSAAHWSLTNPAFPAGSGVARASSLANFLAGVQQVFDDIAGWESWIRIEPCAWRRSLNFGVCSRRSGGCGLPPDAETPRLRRSSPLHHSAATGRPRSGLP